MSANMDTIKDAFVSKERSKKPDYYIMGNSKLSNSLQDSFKKDDENVLFCNVNPASLKQKSKDAMVYSSLEFNSDEIKLPVSYTPYDREVFNAACSLFEAGNEFIWPDQIYRTMTGKTSTEYVKPESLQMIIDSIKKQMMTIVTIDATKQFDEWGIKAKRNSDNKVIFYGNMLNLTGVEASVNGQTIIGWQRLAKGDPILLKYNKALGQVVTVPIQLLDTNSAIKNTPDVIILKNHLIREIERIKNGKSKTDTCLNYEKIFKACAIDINNRDKRKRMKNNVLKILEHYKSTDYITDYEEIKEGKVPVEVRIII